MILNWIDEINLFEHKVKCRKASSFLYCNTCSMDFKTSTLFSVHLLGYKHKFRVSALKLCRQYSEDYECENYDKIFDLCERVWNKIISADTCCVCLDYLDSTCIPYSNCKHKYHLKCIQSVFISFLDSIYSSDTDDETQAKL